MKRILLALIALVVLAAGIAAAGTGSAKALNPQEQTSIGNVVDYTWWDLHRFWTLNFNTWGWRYSYPGVRYFNPGPYTNFNTGTNCGSTSDNTFIYDSGVYCTADRSIYVNVNNAQGLVNTNKDGTAAFLIAHEFAHHIAHLQGRFLGKMLKERELNADCLAGMYFKYGMRYSGLLNATDLAEARYGIYQRFGGDSAGHGTWSERLAWFDYGYATYDIGACNRTFGWYGGPAASRGAVKPNPRVRWKQVRPATKRPVGPPVLAPAPSR